MLIPSIDLKGGQVVQLIQGERPAIASDDIDGWVRKFQDFPRVQVIDLDAAMGSGDNDALVRSIAPRLTCRVGGGIRTVERARAVPTALTRARSTRVSTAWTRTVTERSALRPPPAADPSRWPGAAAFPLAGSISGQPYR